MSDPTYQSRSRQNVQVDTVESQPPTKTLKVETLGSAVGPHAAKPSNLPDVEEPQPRNAVSAARRLDVSRLLVLGEGLAAGMGDFSLSAETQQFSFPALMSGQMGTPLVQPLFQAPGIGSAPGFAPWPALVPSSLQSTVFEQFPPDPVSNLSVPNFRVSDAIRARPRPPLIDRCDSQQTTLNLILGVREMMRGATAPLPTQLETAVQSQPTLAIVELGYAEALQAALTGEMDNLPDINSFHDDYARIVRELRATGATVVVLTIPNPADTAYFSSIKSAAALVKLDEPMLLKLWRLRPDDLITVSGLNEIAFQLNAASVAPASGELSASLPEGSTLPAGAARQLQASIGQWNATILRIARDEGAVVYDLCSFFKRVKDKSIRVGERTLTNQYLGGFYSLNGYYPGGTGQALVANDLLACLQDEFGASFPPVNVEDVMALDPVAHYIPAQGRNWTLEELTSPQPLPVPSLVSDGPETLSENATTAATCAENNSDYALQLPPGLEQVLPVNPEFSYFGDAISAQHCRTAQTIQWGSGNNLLFGGLAMMDSHLSGSIRIKFTAPVGEWTTFQVSFEPGLVGSGSVLTAPTFYKLPGKQQRIGDVPAHPSTGKLNLRTGQVDSTPGSLNIYANFFNSALFALLMVNPNFPKTPLSFPGQYGSASAEFEQRPDGKLDFTFQGSTFVPLGNDTAFPLNFCGPSRQYASIPSNGTALHPHISLTTRESQPPQPDPEAPIIPCNTVQELTLFTAASSFGDLFTLNAPETGGPALGRSHLLGRVQIQFGPRSGNSVPIAVSTCPVGGVFEPLGRTPIAELFPGTLTPGPSGFNETLRFPLQTYSLNDLAIFDDPFDISVGALDLQTGRLLHPLLHRAFINQVVLFALLRVEPRTPKSSFFFKGPGQLRAGSRGELVFDFFGEVHIPYPPGYLFPDTNLSTGFPVVDGGALDPYLWLRGIKHVEAPCTDLTIGSEHSVSSRGDVFSYHFSMCGKSGEGQVHFEYENHSQLGKFEMHSLAWIDHGSATLGQEVFDSITLSCFGVWTKNGVQRVIQAAAQFSTSEHITYAGIQVGPAGKISNVNTLAPANSFPVPLKAAASAGLGADPNVNAANRIAPQPVRGDTQQEKGADPHAQSHH